MRTRTRPGVAITGAVGPLASTDYNLTTGVVVSQGGIGAQAPAVMELIKEDMQDSLGKTGKTNRCLHTKYHLHRIPSTVSTDICVGPNIYNVITGSNASYYQWGNPDRWVSHGIVDISWPSLSDLVNQAVAGWYKGENDVDSLLNIWEAPELVSSIKSAADYLQPENLQKINRACLVGLPQYKEYYHGYKVYKRSKRAYLLDSPTVIMNLAKSPVKCFAAIWKAAASGFLLWSFAIAPLVSDARKLHRALPRALEQAKKLNNVKPIRVTHRAGQGTLKGFNLDATLTRYHSGRSPTTTGNCFWTLVPSVMEAPSVHVTVRGETGHSFSSKHLQALDRLLGKYGVSGPASMAWELVPFSFVLDWFIDSSTLLGKIDSALTGGSKITDISYSYKWKYHLDVSITGYKEWRPAEGNRVVSWVELSYYLRDGYTGNIDLVFWSSRFGKRQRNLSIALASQQLGAMRLH